MKYFESGFASTCGLILCGTFASVVSATVYGAAFPDFQGKNEYVVTPENAVGLVIDTLYIPRGKTIRVAPGVKRISWTVKNIRIEEDATIDLSAVQTPPQKAANGGGPPPQVGYCARGQDGYAGQNGIQGNLGVDLSFNEIFNIEILGSLWVRTDGGPGGEGGDGGRGGLGGGHYSKWPDRPCGAGPGGSGGQGGAAGLGGTTSRVIFLKAQDGTAYGFPNGEAPTCGRSTRPSAATGKSGVIAIYGGRGCDGASGKSGAPGDHG